jgi:hypothetical protein
MEARRWFLAHAAVVTRPMVAHAPSGDFTRSHEAVLGGDKVALEAGPRTDKIVAKPGDEERILPSPTSAWYGS